MKMKINKMRRKGVLAITAAILVAVFAFIFTLPLKLQNDGGMYALNTISAYAYSIFPETPSIEVQSYHVQMNVREDRKVEVQEQIQVKFLKSGLTMFYRMLPKEGTRYYDIQASCEGNAEFSYYVAENPDQSDFFDINCVGGAAKGNVWTYDISYTMEAGAGATRKYFIVDVIGFGWPVALHNVQAEITFPDKAESIDLYVGEYGVGEMNGSASAYAENLLTSVSDDGKTVRMSAQELKLVYNDIYEEYMAAGFTVRCKFAKGVLADYTKTRIFTKDMPWIVFGGISVIIAALAVCLVTRKKHELITVVNVAAPDEMDPLKMGVMLDGTVDKEDITSMIYYFADKGYLEIDFSDEDNPVLVKKADLPKGAPVYMQTLFNGLFKRKDSVAVSDLAEKYCASVEIAKKQLPTPSMYERKSILGFVCGGVLGGLYMALTPFLMGKINLHFTYNYLFGFVGFIPIFLILFVLYLRENYRYKWKKTAHLVAWLGVAAVAGLATLLFVVAFAQHLMTGYEIALMCIASFAATFIGAFSLSRKEDYVKELGNILGFKDFIIYTEEDKIKFMLETNPQLYYKILPYAQVLGVTDEWEDKFKNILIPPPTWGTGMHMSVFDYMVLNSCMRRAMATAMRPPQTSGGVSGGGGNFGGFGGGGFGGGGGGAR